MNGETLELNFAQPVAASTQAAESIHTDGLGFISLPPTRRCRECKQMLPWQSFESKGKRKKQRVCKACRLSKKQRYKRIYEERHRDQVKKHARRHTENKRLRDKPKIVARYAAQLEQAHGPLVANAYVQLQRDNPRAKARVPLEKLVALAVKFQGRPLTLNNALRIIQLNRLSNQRTDNLGWHCAHCAAPSDDFRFFDIDHITPRSKRGHGRLANLQILCPSCHRRKTITDLYPPVSRIDA